MSEWLSSPALLTVGRARRRRGPSYKQGIGSKTRLFEHSFTWFECIDVTFVARKSLRAIVVYRPPGGVSVGVFLEKFSSLLQETVICPEELLIYGDFNFHMDDKADWDATRFGELLDLFNLKQHVCVPTDKRGHILDLHWSLQGMRLRAP